MAVAIIATVSGATSNSYITLADFDTYLETRVSNTKADAATDDQKNRALVQAARILDRYVVWYGTKAESTQALAHPRTNLYDRNAVSLSSTAIPQVILDAACEIAILLITADRQVEVDQKGVKSFGVGSLNFEFDKYDAKRVLPAYIWQIVSHLGDRVSGGMGFAVNRG